ncbi:MAG: hydroxymethylpyrimidine/phosphomethylpyrimidine kinase [Gammaproteobacteria bacterium]|nr:hydroxymethylpyrimidine/phosphomethylpyrimidine kinase [Gammaproteobacteria bacterium]
MNSPARQPSVLVFAGHDPCGGAGIQADIEAISANGAHAATVITAHTVQDSVRVRRFVPADAVLLEEQARLLLTDLEVRAIKIGMIGNMDTLVAILRILQDHPAIPLILDPVMAGGGGGALMDDAVGRALLELIVPRTLVLTPNSIEARRLAARDPLEECAHYLLSLGCQYVFIKGSHEPSPTIVHTLYHATQSAQRLETSRLPHHYHGSGCTLAASIAAYIAQQQPVFTAIQRAQAYTYRSLQHAYRIGQGQRIPQRCPRADK